MPERSPEITPTCLKCGSDAMVPGVRMLDVSDSGAKPARVSVQRKPEATFFKGEEKVETRAMVCGDCGFIELYATDPAALWDAHIDRLARRL